MAVIVFGKMVRPFDDDDGAFRKLSVGDDFELLVPLGDDVELLLFFCIFWFEQSTQFYLILSN